MITIAIMLTIATTIMETRDMMMTYLLDGKFERPNLTNDDESEYALAN